MQKQNTAITSENASLSRRGVMGLAIAALSISPDQVSAGEADELSFIIDEYRDTHAYRLTLTERLIALEADEPVTTVTRAEIRPSIGWAGHSEFLSEDRADIFFASTQTAGWANDTAKTTYAKAWKFTKALFLEKRAQHDRWKAETGYGELLTEEETLFDHEAALLHSIVSRPCVSFAEAKVLADFVISDISDSTFYQQHAIALRSIAGRAA